MPGFARLRTEVLRELALQLRFVPPETARRQLERAEKLAAEIDPAAEYPEDYIVFRITGYRPEEPVAAPGRAGKDGPMLWPGARILSDLIGLIERLSAHADLDESEVPAWLTTADLLARWRVSSKTVERLRRAGLVARRVRTGRGRQRLAFDPSVVARFEAAHVDRLTRARGFSRIDTDVQRRMIRRAGAYHRRLGWSLSRMSQRLAAKFGRTRQAVSELLKRENAARLAAGLRPLFTVRAASTQRDARLAVRSRRRGATVSEIGRKLGRSRASVERTIARRRLRALRAFTAGLADPHVRGAPVPLSTHSPDAADDLEGWRTLGQLIDLARRIAPWSADLERETFRQYRSLLRTAAEVVSAIDDDAPKAAALTEAEALLRAASRVKIRLMCSQSPLLLRTIEARLARPVTSIPGSPARDLIRGATDALSLAIDQHKHGRGGRLAATVGLALNREVSRWAVEHGYGAPTAETRTPSALARVDPARVRIDDWRYRVHPWTAELGLADRAGRRARRTRKVGPGA